MLVGVRLYAVLHAAFSNKNPVTIPTSSCFGFIGISAKAQNNLGAVLLTEGKTAQAIKCFEIALRLRPDDAMARESLEEARAQLGK